MNEHTPTTDQPTEHAKNVEDVEDVKDFGNVDTAPADTEPVATAVVDAAVAAKRYDPDAAVGSKTRKDGKTESFYGYHEHTLVQVPDRGTKADDTPRLITRVEITPANADVVEVSLSLLDRLQNKAEVLIADRHYHYKRADRWRDELADRGIDQIHDLRIDEHGFSEHQHMRWAAGWPHCPATPDRYGTIERPGPANIDKTAMATFKTAIGRRFDYALRRVTTPDPRGVARWECPAIAGKVGCPLRAGTVDAALQHGLPIVENPPDPRSPDFPVCCAQRTVTADPGPLRKLMQHHYWGSDDWETEWAKRTYVEGSYGNRKNTSTENLRRGHFRITGLARINLVAAMTAASYNLRILRNWHERTGHGDPDHPLLQPAEQTYGTVNLTREQYERFCAEQLRGTETDEAA